MLLHTDRFMFLNLFEHHLSQTKSTVSCVLALALLSFGAVESHGSLSVDPELLKYAQTSNSLSPDLERISATRDDVIARPLAFYERDGQDRVRVWLRGRPSIAAITGLGGEIGSVSGELLTADIPVSAIGRLLQTANISQIQLAQPLSFQTDVSMSEIEVDELWGGPPPPPYPTSGTTGKDVVVGIVDTGIDALHEDFRTASFRRGQTNLSWLSMRRLR